MIDDREVIAEIAYATQEKFLLSGETLAKDEKRVIRFSDAEISSFIRSVALSGAQREEVKKILE